MTPETARVVAFIRAQEARYRARASAWHGDHEGADKADALDYLADAIEAGEHLTDPPA